MYFAVPVILFVFTSGISRPSNRPVTVSGKSWFLAALSFDPQDPYVAGQYLKIPNNPMCSESTGEVCAVFATEDGNTGHPTQASLDSIGAVSNNFSAPISGLLELRTPPFGLSGNAVSGK